MNRFLAILKSFVFDALPGLLMYATILAWLWLYGAFTGKSGFVGNGTKGGFYVLLLPAMMIFLACFFVNGCIGGIVPSYRTLALCSVNGVQMEITELNGRFSIAERGTAGILYFNRCSVYFTNISTN